MSEWDPAPSSFGDEFGGAPTNDFGGSGADDFGGKEDVPMSNDEGGDAGGSGDGACRK